MNEHVILDALALLLVERYEISDTALDEVAQVMSFDDAGLLTPDTGMVLKMADGSEFQITIRQAR